MWRTGIHQRISSPEFALHFTVQPRAIASVLGLLALELTMFVLPVIFVLSHDRKLKDKTAVVMEAHKFCGCG